MSHQETAAGILTDLADKIKKVEAEILVVEEYQEYLFDVMALNRKKDCERQFEEMVIVELAGKCSELSADGKQQKTTGSNNGNATDGTLTDLADKVNSVEAEIQVCHVKNGNTESTSKDAVEEGVQASTTSESAEWGLFDRDLIITAVSSIYCPAQRAHLGCLNKWWKEVMKEVPEIPVRLLPWPIFPSTENPCYHSTVGKITYRLNLPEDIKNARFCGSFENWWFVLAWDQPRHHGDEMRHHELYHLRSNERIILPINAKIGDSIHMVQMKAAVLSAPPRPLGAKYVVAAVLQVEDIQQPRVGFWQETMKEWILEPTFDLVVEDLIWHLGNLHVLTANEDVHVLFPEFDEMSAWRIDYRVQQRPTYVGDIQLATGRGGSLRRYLVESDGDLMMVVKVQYINQRAEFLQVVSLNTEIEDGVAVFDENDFFRIHNGDIEDAVAGRASWDEVDYRFGRLFFVGSACSRHFHAKRNEQACIYFLDDRGIREPGTGLLLMDDTGRFLLFDRHVEAWPPTAGVLLPRASDRLPIWCIH
uniref:Uncharacterized protein n=1 Tax=Avena sativa TaxID=4498 RepID=A0ACD5VG22_AVESA